MPRKPAPSAEFRDTRSSGMTIVDRLERIRRYANDLADEGDALAAYIGARIKRDIDAVLSALPRQRG
jgi:hypothetical protein